MLDPSLVDTPALFPNVALGGSQTGPLIDTKYTLRPYGRVYVTESQVRDWARLYGMVEKSDLLEVQAENAVLKALNAEQAAELAELDDVRSALIGAAQRFGGIEADDEPVRKKRAA